MSSVGVPFDKFDVPVCNSFQAKIHNDQLCYQVDLNEFSNDNEIESELKIGFNFIMDYNEDRQVVFENDQSIRSEEKVLTLGNSVVESNENENAIIYLDTVGKYAIYEIRFSALRIVL